MKKNRSPVYYVGGWLVLTLSLVSWWLIYGLRQLSKVASLEKSLPPSVAHPFSDSLIAQERMLRSEGGSLLALLLLGGAALFYYSLQERKRNDQIEEFFATLTHELKTPLASLRLQAESLGEDLSHTPHSALVGRLVQDTVRLELQLENALFLASVRSREQLHLENVNVSALLLKLQTQWPEIMSKVDHDLVVTADSRALEGILKNIFQNSRVHGKAKEIYVKADGLSKTVCLFFEDNGTGFSGDVAKLGKLFVRPTTRSGSGVGLYLAKTLARSMNGSMQFDSSKGFIVKIFLEKGINS